MPDSRLQSSCTAQFDMTNIHDIGHGATTVPPSSLFGLGAALAVDRRDKVVVAPSDKYVVLGHFSRIPHAFLSPVLPHTCCVTYSAQRPCSYRALLDVDWCLQSDVVANPRLQQDRYGWLLWVVAMGGC